MDYRLAPDAPGQKRALALMETIQVYSASSLVLRRHVTVNGRKIFGEDERGRTVLQRSKSSACLYFSSESIAGGSLPWHFVCDSLLSFLEIAEERLPLLNSILHARDHTLIEDILERAGLFEGKVLPDHTTLVRKSNGTADGGRDKDEVPDETEESGLAITPTTRPDRDKERPHD